jgi:mRNA interferase RelE/StbE
LAENPFDPRLSSALVDRVHIRKSRVGGWRILFTVDRDAKVIYVLTIDTRGQVYRN